MDVTYRVVNLKFREEVGQTASTPELAKLAADNLTRTDRLALEQTDWTEEYGKLKVRRSVITEVENHAGEWTLGI
jgi:hypothetical protein